MRFFLNGKTAATQIGMDLRQCFRNLGAVMAVHAHSRIAAAGWIHDLPGTSRQLWGRRRDGAIGAMGWGSRQPG